MVYFVFLGMGCFVFLPDDVEPRGASNVQEKLFLFLGFDLLQVPEVNHI